MVRSWRVARLAPAVILLACSDAASPLVVLDKPDQVLDRTFQQVSNIIELRDGRVALAELKDRTFLFVDFTTGDATPVGVHADTIRDDGPATGVHRLPGYVLRFAGDTIGLVDFAEERTSLWNEQGQFLRIIGGGKVGGTNQALAWDWSGHSYKEDLRTVLGGLEPGAELGFDSLAVMRITDGDTVADTVARLKLPVWGRGQFGETVKIVSTIFSGRDVFGVLPDGSLWAARANDNRVDWRSPAGDWTRGEERSFAVISVTQEERDAFLEKLRVQMMQMGAPAGIELKYPFADTKPPFSSATASPAGEVWLQRSRAFADSLPVWDVIGRDGKPIRTVQLPRGASVGGFGQDGRVYLILRDSEGRQTVARYVVK
jgi:hypothetical protein